MIFDNGSIIPLNIHFDVAGRVRKVESVEVLYKFGRGAFGEVWVVAALPERRDIYLLKHFDLSNLSSEERTVVLTTIQKEVNVKIDSPYVCTALGSARFDPDHAAILFPYRTGQNLREWIRHEDILTIPGEERKELFRKILEGIRAIHEHETRPVHRDLKPENIFLTDNNIPQIIDFGSAKLQDPNLTFKQANVMGTFPYTPPEMLYAQRDSSIKIEQRAHHDVYAAGIIFYELMTGQKPYSPMSDLAQFEEFVQQHPDGNILDWHQHKFGQPFKIEADGTVERIIREATRFHPAKRTQTIASMIAQLSGEEETLDEAPIYSIVPEFLAEQILEPPPPPPRPVVEEKPFEPAVQKRPKKSRKWIGALVIAALIAIAGYSLSRKQKPEPEPIALTPVSEPEPTPTPIPSPSPTPEFVLRFRSVKFLYSHHIAFQNGRILCPREQQLAPNMTLRTDDCYRMVFTPEQQTYVYILHVDGAGNIFRLFPPLASRTTSVRNPVKGGFSYSIPVGGRWMILNTRPGLQRIYFLVSPYAEPDLERPEAALTQEILEKYEKKTNNICPTCIPVLSFYQEE